ncbi:MAG: hypothetical protein RL156_1728 [Bacteroidota bacterium]|jgi:hypothetical protein
MKITVTLKNVYGNQSVYPLDEHAHRFAKIAGTKTLSRDALANVRALGFEVVFVDPAAVALSESINGGNNV